MKISAIIVNSTPYFIMLFFFDLVYFLLSVNSIYRYIFVFIAGFTGTAAIIALSVLLYRRKNIGRLIALIFFDIHFPAVMIYYFINFKALSNLLIGVNVYFQFRMVLALLEVFLIVFLSRKDIRGMFD